VSFLFSHPRDPRVLVSLVCLKRKQQKDNRAVIVLFTLSTPNRTQSIDWNSQHIIGECSETNKFVDLEFKILFESVKRILLWCKKKKKPRNQIVLGRNFLFEVVQFESVGSQWSSALRRVMHSKCRKRTCHGCLEPIHSPTCFKSETLFRTTTDQQHQNDLQTVGVR
jgi:hypothetical protein